MTDALIERLAQDARDAARYRFLRDQYAVHSHDDKAAFAALAPLHGRHFDNVIDNAMKDAK